MNNTIFVPASPSPSVTKKINSLHKLLLREKLLFEEVAGTVTDNALRCTLLSVAQQNNQYAAELSSHMQTTRTVAKIKKRTSAKHPDHVSAYNITDTTTTALGVCNSNERKIIAAYRKLLKENTLYDGLQQMVHYQLDGIVFACLQLKLLRSLSRGRKQRHVVAY